MKLIRSGKTHRRLYATLFSASIVLAGLLAPLGSAGAQSNPFADPAFRRVWERTDLPVAQGRVSRTWLWGPSPGHMLFEPFREGAGGTHLVQYFDKARMEINDPGGIPASPFYVSNGLLVVEMISGRVQTGASEFADFGSNPERIAGDDGSGAPSYVDLRSVASVGLPNSEHRAVPLPVGSFVPSLYIGRGGIVDQVAPELVHAREIRIATYIRETGHNIPDVFWNYLNSQGLVYENGKYTNSRLMDWTSALGYPVTEPYWTTIKVQGRDRSVLFQAFQRRVLTYSRDNPEGWKVEMGNVGAQYYTWRYESPTISCASMPVRGFGKVWAEHRNVQRVGCPFDRELAIPTSYQPFEHGVMLYADLSAIFGRSPQNRPIYVFFDDGTFQQFDDTWHEGDQVNSGLTPPAGLFEPEKRFGKVWREGTGARVRQRLGWAAQPSQDGPGAFQRFAQGEMLWVGSARKIYVLYGPGYDWPYPVGTPPYDVYDDTYTP